MPEYWSPPSLFNLALRTGFDIESLIFCFGIGGIGVVLYNVLTGVQFEPVSESYKRLPLHKHHRLAISSPFIAYPFLYFLPWNPIYSAFVAMIIGAVANVLCRPELKKKTWIGGVLFTVYYGIFLEGLNLLSPGYLDHVWNIDALSGILILHLHLVCTGRVFMNILPGQNHKTGKIFFEIIRYFPLVTLNQLLFIAVLLYK